MTRPQKYVCSNCGESFHGLTPCMPKPKPTINPRLTANALRYLAALAEKSNIQPVISNAIRDHAADLEAWMDAQEKRL